MDVYTLVQRPRNKLLHEKIEFRMQLKLKLLTILPYYRGIILDFLGGCNTTMSPWKWKGELEERTEEPAAWEQFGLML